MANNTVEAAFRTVREIEGLTERLNLARNGSEISGADIILMTSILNKVRNAILLSAAYPAIEIELEELPA